MWNRQITLTDVQAFSLQKKEMISFLFWVLESPWTPDSDFESHRLTACECKRKKINLERETEEQLYKKHKRKLTSKNNFVTHWTRGPVHYRNQPGKHIFKCQKELWEAATRRWVHCGLKWMDIVTQHFIPLYSLTWVGEYHNEANHNNRTLL